MGNFPPKYKSPWVPQAWRKKLFCCGFDLHSKVVDLKKHLKVNLEKSLAYSLEFPMYLEFYSCKNQSLFTCLGSILRFFLEKSDCTLAKELKMILFSSFWLWFSDLLLFSYGWTPFFRLELFSDDTIWLRIKGFVE